MRLFISNLNCCDRSNIAEMSQNQINPKQFEFIFFYGSSPIRKLIQATFDVDIKSVFPDILDDTPFIQKGSKQVQLDLVSRDHVHGAEESLYVDITFLLNAAKVVFDIVKVGVEKDGVKFMLDYELNMDDFDNIYIDGFDEYRLGAIVTDITPRVEEL